MQRRDFLKLVGGSACGLVMATCGGGGGDDGGQSLPSGYEWYRLFSTGDNLPNGAEALFLPGSVKINDRGGVIFHAGDRTGFTGTGLVMGVYELLLDYDGWEPISARFRQVVRQGDLLAGGREAAVVGLAGLNNQGAIACKLRLKDEPTESIYFERPGQAMEPVVEYLTPLPGDTGGRFSASLGNFDIDHHNNLMVSAHYFTDGAEDSGEGLFHLPDAQVNAAGALLLGAGDMVPETVHVIDRLGLFESNGAQGDYVVQVHTSPLEGGTEYDRSGFTSSTAVIKGSLHDRRAGAMDLLAAPNGSATRSAKISGTMYYGPRIGGDGSTAMTVHVSPNEMVLVYNDRILASTGGKTPSGRTIYSFGAPIVGPDGLVYFVAYTDNGSSEELLVSNGAKVRSLLSSGLRFGDSRDGKLISIAFGHSRDQVDAEGRLVFIGEFDNKTLSVMVGVPV